jgi:hypothetical protein
VEGKGVAFIVELPYQLVFGEVVFRAGYAWLEPQRMRYSHGMATATSLFGLWPASSMYPAGVIPVLVSSSAAELLEWGRVVAIIIIHNIRRGVIFIIKYLP